MKLTKFIIVVLIAGFVAGLLNSLFNHFWPDNPVSFHRFNFIDLVLFLGITYWVQETDFYNRIKNLNRAQLESLQKSLR